jgi:hypothetical protein
MHKIALPLLTFLGVQELNEALTSYWGPISRFGPEQIESFEYGGYFSTLMQEGLRVISYNSNYG